MDAAAYGALFFFAMAASAFAGGAAWVLDDKNALTIVLSSAGIGSLLYLVGRALWEVAFPYVPDHKLRRLGLPGSAQERFRLALANEYLGPLPTFVGMTLDDAHRKVIAVERIFYTSAPDPIVQWCKRRYDRFVMALSASAAIVIGIVVGLAIAGDPSKLYLKLLVDVLLLVVVALTMLWAVEVRHHAQAMESAWFAIWHATKDRVDPTVIAFTELGESGALSPVSPLTVAFADNATLDVHDRVSLGLKG